MNIIGLIAEYNPFHLGHLYQINKIKELYPNSLIILITNNCFSQRGEVFISNKWNKTKIAIDNNIDLVIELPFVYGTQSSDIFAKGSIEILNYLKIDTLVFGSETNDIELLKKIANTQIYSNDYHLLVKKYLSDGINYPTALSKSLKELLNVTIDKPNDLLALSYIKEIIKQNDNITPISIQRTNNYHSKNIDSDVINASLIRELLHNNTDISKYIPKYNINNLYPTININKYYSLLKYKIIINKDNLNKFQTVDEGIENRIIKYVNSSSSWQELVNNIKSKRYTYNKINRMLIHILTDFTKEDANNLKIDYIRVLGFNNKGKTYLNKIKKEINIPLITNYKKNISKILDIELKITSIYDIVANDNLIKEEYSHKPIIK